MKNHCDHVWMSCRTSCFTSQVQRPIKLVFLRMYKPYFTWIVLGQSIKKISTDNKITVPGLKQCIISPSIRIRDVSRFVKKKDRNRTHALPFIHHLRHPGRSSFVWRWPLDSNTRAWRWPPSQPMGPIPAIYSALIKPLTIILSPPLSKFWCNKQSSHVLLKQIIL